MQVTHGLAQEIRTYIKNLIDKEVMIVDRSGVCIASYDEATIGSSFELPRIVFEKTDTHIIAEGDKERLVIPLRYQMETVAALVLDDNAPEMQTYIPLIKSFAELLVQQYQVVNQPVLDSTDRFVTKLLDNATPAELPFYESEAKVLGYNFTTKRLAIVIHLRNFWEKCLASFDQPTFDREEVIKDWKRNIESKLAGFFTKTTDNIIAYIGNDRFVVFKGVDADEEENTIKLLKKSYKAIFEPLQNFHINSIAVGFGNAHEGLSGLINSYREADLALDFGVRLWGDNKSYYFGDLGILSILGEGNREKEMQFADQMLNNLTNEDLVKTLECFFSENLNLTETANKMGIHRNTVIYRLNQISNILGVDPRVFEQAMTIKIALLIKKLFG